MVKKENKNEVSNQVIKNSYLEVVNIINSARERAYSKVNEELILMYQKIGKYISEKSKDTNYGDSFVDSLAKFFEKEYPDIKGFTRRGLYRMK